MNILIAPDKFKASLTASEAAAAIRQGFEAAGLDASYRELPIADGGEGTAEILCAARGGDWLTTDCLDPLGEPAAAEYALLPGNTAVINMSAASGLWRVPAERRNPLWSSTFGTGQLIAHALRRGARKLLVGLGGSATNDGGMGLAAALGYEFIDEAGTKLPPLPVHLSRLAKVRHASRPPQVEEVEMIALCDVDNPLLGVTGATQVYGPQKGAGPESLDILEEGLRRLANVVARDLDHDYRDTPGAGAAGGLGFGLLSFCGARLQPGFETVAEILDLEDAVRWCDLVVTGEGRLDAQTLAGKGPAGVALLARRLGKPVVAFAGSISSQVAARKLFDVAIALVDADTSSADAMRNAATVLGRRAHRFAITQLAQFVPRREWE